MSGAWGFARDFESSILVGALARERRSTTGADEGALADDAQVRPPPSKIHPGSSNLTPLPASVTIL
jgi:hypothetical protein